MTTGKPDELAVNVANRVLDHLRTMYPDALKAVPASAQISLRNVTISAASAAILAAKAEEREVCAQVADEHSGPFAEGSIFGAGETFAAKNIAAAIRQLGDVSGAHNKISGEE